MTTHKDRWFINRAAHAVCPMEHCLLQHTHLSRPLQAMATALKTPFTLPARHTPCPMQAPCTGPYLKVAEPASHSLSLVNSVLKVDAGLVQQICSGQHLDGLGELAANVGTTQEVQALGHLVIGPLHIWGHCWRGGGLQESIHLCGHCAARRCRSADSLRCLTPGGSYVQQMASRARHNVLAQQGRVGRCVLLLHAWCMSGATAVAAMACRAAFWVRGSIACTDAAPCVSPA